MIIIMSTNSMALITSRGKEKTKTLSEVTSAAISIPFFFFFLTGDEKTRYVYMF